MASPQINELELSVSVRGLADATTRSGGLAGSYYGGVDGLTGIRNHQRYLERLKTTKGVDEVFSEYSLTRSYKSDQTTLNVRGRADAWFYSGHAMTLIEIKSYRGDAVKLPKGGEAVHWNQLKLYAYMLLVDTASRELTCDLTYVSVDSDETVIHRRNYDIDDLTVFFEDTCLSFIKSTRTLRHYIVARDKANKAASFPYRAVRAGQKTLMRRVMDTIISKGILLTSAPTGIGKTIATLYPALKAQANKKLDRIFYLTHTTSTRLVAAQALADLRAGGFLARTVTLYAKESLCLEPDIYCDMRVCPYALDYYERVPDALAELYRLQAIDPSNLVPIARKHKVCPFELSLDVSLWCDVIIADYNYVFDPRVRLQRFFGEITERMTILVDEAHNLPGRAREMYSARLSLRDLSDVYMLLNSKEIGPNTNNRQDLQAIVGRASEMTMQVYNRLAAVATSLTHSVAENKKAGFSLLDDSIDKSDMVLTESFAASRILPSHLLAMLARLYRTYAIVLDSFPDWHDKQPFLHLWFDLAYFFRLGVTAFDDTYLITLRKQDKRDWLLSLQCLDASVPMNKCIDKTMSCIYFSATLSPMAFYQPQLSQPENQVERLTLPSPFPERNRLVLASDACSIRYKDREQSLPEVANIILEACSRRRGNYLVFAPSFAYLNRLGVEIKRQHKASQGDLLFQKSGLSRPGREAFLNRFKSTNDKTLIAFSVIGSLFNEGVDLVGERLIGVIIIGTGLPAMSPDRSLMGQYFEHRLGDGFSFAYVYPGFNRILQAAGRLIRSETDKGIILLLDDRYKRDDYQQLLPEEWRTKFVGGVDDINAYLDEFWSQVD